MTAATYNLVIDQGSDFVIDMVVKEGGVPKDLTGYLARAQLRPTITSSTLSGSFSCTVVSPGTDGKIKMELLHDASSAMEAGRYFYDLEVYTPNNVIVKRLIQGEAVINPEVTR